MAGRKVTVSIASNCGGAEIHQPIWIQLSIGERWVPHDGPKRFPPLNPDGSSPTGTGAGSPTVQVKDVAETLREHMAASPLIGHGVSDAHNVTGVSEVKTDQGTTSIFSFSFETEMSEVDYSVNGVTLGTSPSRTGTDGPAGTPGTQLDMCLTVEEGEGEFRVKKVSVASLFEAIEDKYPRQRPLGRRRKGPRERKKPSQTIFDASDFKSGEGGTVGDKLLGLAPLVWGGPLRNPPLLPDPFWQTDQRTPFDPWQLEAVLLGFYGEAIRSIALRDLYPDPNDRLPFEHPPLPSISEDREFTETP